MDYNIEAKVRWTKVIKNVYRYEQKDDSNPQRPIVLVFGWLSGKWRHVEKYSKIYIDEGYDVLQIQVKLRHLLSPKRATSMMKSVLTWCQEEDRKSQPIFVHCLSSGVYLYGELLVLTTTNKDCADNFSDRLLGQIFDSPFDITNAPNSFAIAMTSIGFLQRFLKKCFAVYLRLATKTMKCYLAVSDVIKDNMYKTPTKAFYSLSDDFCDIESIRKTYDSFIERGIYTEIETWKDVPHVSIYRFYPDVYKNYIKDFLEICKKENCNGKT